jgi:hypothetical protein
MVGTPINFDPNIVKLLESYSYQDIVVPVGNWIANDKGDNIRFGIWSGSNFATLQNVVIKYAINSDLLSEPILPGNIYDIGISENNLYKMAPFDSTNYDALKGLVLYGDYYRNPSKDFVLTENMNVYTIVLLNTETGYFYGLSLPTKGTGTGLIDLPNPIPSSGFVRVRLYTEYARLELVPTLNPGDYYLDIIGSNPFYGTLIVSNKIARR